MHLVYVLFTALLLAAPVLAQGESGKGQGPDMVQMVIMMGGILAIMYFLMIRPEQKKQKERQSMLGSLKKGQKVVTTGGIHGTLGNVKDKTAMVKVADGVVLEVAKASIASVANDKDEE